MPVCLPTKCDAERCTLQVLQHQQSVGEPGAPSGNSVHGLLWNVGPPAHQGGTLHNHRHQTTRSSCRGRRLYLGLSEWRGVQGHLLPHGGRRWILAGDLCSGPGADFASHIFAQAAGEFGMSAQRPGATLTTVLQTVQCHQRQRAPCGCVHSSAQAVQHALHSMCTSIMPHMHDT